MNRLQSGPVWCRSGPALPPAPGCSAQPAWLTRSAHALYAAQTAHGSVFGDAGPHVPSGSHLLPYSCRVLTDVLLDPCFPKLASLRHLEREPSFRFGPFPHLLFRCAPWGSGHPEIVLLFPFSLVIITSYWQVPIWWISFFTATMTNAHNRKCLKQHTLLSCICVGWEAIGVSLDHGQGPAGLRTGMGDGEDFLARSGVGRIQPPGPYRP